VNNNHYRFGFVSTRLAGNDGVSLETAKWAHILTGLGHECFCFAGETDWPAERSYVVPEAHFLHTEITTLTDDLFGDNVRSSHTTQRIQVLKDHLKSHLNKFVTRFKPDILIAENILSLPVNIPLGLALTEFIAETGLPVIAHDHDFAWDRERFDLSAANDYLRAAFPPVFPSIHHVVINSFAARQLAMRTGERCVLIPNVMDFDAPLPSADTRTAEFRQALGIGSEEVVLLQPTRIVPRKRIERSIELARRLNLPCVLVISHSSGDEGYGYESYLKDFAKLLNVRVIFAADKIGSERGQKIDGDASFSLADAYLQADLVTYPSAVEGFGNAFLEAMYYRRPIIMSSYEIFNIDIKPKGFKVIAFSEFISESTINEVVSLLHQPELVAEIVEQNFNIARRYYSYNVLEKLLVTLINESVGAS
jgi:glycosyltransferase involved in cell wall biosynthesis